MLHTQITVGRRDHRCTTVQQDLPNLYSYHISVIDQQFLCEQAERYMHGTLQVTSSKNLVNKTKCSTSQFNRETWAHGWKWYKWITAHYGSHECRHSQKRWSDIKWRSTLYTNPQCQWNSQATMLSGNHRKTCTHTQRLCITLVLIATCQHQQF